MDDESGDDDRRLDKLNEEVNRDSFVARKVDNVESEETP